MAEFPITKVLAWIIIIIAVAVLLIGGRDFLWKAAKSGLSLIGIINYTEVDYSAVNQNAISTFNALIKDINKCLASKDKNCACEASFSGFFETHKLESDGGELKLINIKERNEITMKKEKIQGLNCYLDGKNIKKLNKLGIFFNNDLPYIPVSGFLGLDALKSDAKFDKALKLYKNNEMCWITSKADLTNVKTCS